MRVSKSLLLVVLQGRGPADLDWFAPWIDSTCPDGRCRCGAALLPSRVGARPERQSACARGPRRCGDRPPGRVHSQSVGEPERRRSPRGGGAGAAWQPPYGSVEPPPASGTGAAGTGRQRPALQRVRTSRLLPRPSSGRPPLAT